jgi:acyl carrier protein
VSDEQILQDVREILRTEFEVDSTAVVPAARLREDLDLDSIDAVALAARLEQLTGLFLKEERLTRLRTVQDVVDLVSELSRRERGRSASP